jgi:high-affinity nickel permease
MIPTKQGQVFKYQVAGLRAPVLLGTAFLAYTFGLRRAVDADHIAAIDNVTRKLMNEGQRPVSVLMLGAYGWAFLNPLRKLFYNLTVTAVSALVAVLVGGIEILGLIDDQCSFSGWFWDTIRSLNDNFGTIGYLIIGLFIVSWFFSLVIYRMKGYDKVVTNG